MIISVDTETTGIFPFRFKYPNRVLEYVGKKQSIFARSARAKPEGMAKPFMVGFYESDKHYGTFDVEKGEDFREFKSLYEDSSVVKVFHNAAFDIQMLEHCMGMRIVGRIEDTMLALSYIYPGQRLLPLKEMAALRLGIHTKEEKKLDWWIQSKMKEYKAKFNREPGFYDAPRHIIQEYLVSDIRYTLALYNNILPELEKDKGYALYRTECELIPFVCRAYIRGILFSEERLAAANKECDGLLIKYKRVLEKGGFPELNPRSAKQVNEVLFKKLGFMPKDRTPTGQPKTSGTIIEKYKHPVADTIYKYRQICSVKSNHLRSLSALLDKNSCAHPDFLMQGAVTGRMASKNPNFQNLKQIEGRHEIETGIGSWLRHALIVRKGYSMVAFDFKQIEFRILVHFSKEPMLIKILCDGQDPHTEVAKILYGTYDEKRRILVKTFHFGILYGMGPDGLAERLGCDIKEAREMMEVYHRMFPGVKRIQQELTLRARKLGYTFSLFGRKVPVNKDAAYTAINYLCQGSASDIMKLGYVKVSKYLETACKKAMVIFSVHDELDVELPLGQERHIKIIKNVLEGSVKLRVPIPVDCKVFHENWRDAEKIK